MAPTAMVGTPASLRIRSAKGVWNMRPYTGCSSLLTCPDEQSTISAPASWKARAIKMASSGVMPPSTQSCAEIRTDIGRWSGRSEEHTSELQSRPHLVCRLLLEKKNKHQARALG